MPPYNKLHAGMFALATALTSIPQFRDLGRELTAVVVDVADWYKTLNEAHERVRKCWEAALVVTVSGAPMLLAGDAYVRLGTADADHLCDVMTCFRYLLLDGRMFTDLSETISVLARYARLNGCRIVLLLPTNELPQIVEALDCEPTASATRH